METSKRIKSAAEQYKQRRIDIKKRVFEVAAEVRQSRQEQKAKLAQ